jgi:hypothetical protein
VRDRFPRLLVQPLHSTPVGSLQMHDRVRLALEIVVAYVPLLVRLRRGTLPDVVASARSAGHPAVTTPTGAAHDEAVRLGSMVDKVLRRLPTDSRCLIQSLVLVRLLARRSIGASVVIGVHVGERFAAHAWVEHEGRAVLPAWNYERLLEL